MRKSKARPRELVNCSDCQGTHTAPIREGFTPIVSCKFNRMYGAYGHYDGGVRIIYKLKL